MSKKKAPQEAKQYSEGLTAEQAASAMQAARFNALDLMDTADMLFNLKRFPHSVAFSTLSMEETSKVSILLLIFLGFGGDYATWKSYRQHRAKTQSLNLGIQARVRATFPEIPLEAAKEIGKLGPTPDELETAKQHAMYSDCLEVSGDFVCHLPRNIDWRQQAWDRLCEAKALVFGLRDYPPEELVVWLEHAEAVKGKGGNFRDMLRVLHKDLLDKGFIKKGSWDTLLEDIEN